MNEEAIAALVNTSLLSAQQTQSSLLLLGSQIISGLLMVAGIIAVAILAHAVIHGMIVRSACKAKRN